MDIGILLGSGRDADVYALDDDWVLRRYRKGGDAGREADTMSYLHAHGYPVPRIRPVDPSAPTDLVMQRVTGQTLLEAGLNGTVTVDESAAILADLLNRLHMIPPRTSAPDTLDADRTSILHLDLHPFNVLLAADGRPTVIDWTTAREGRPWQDWGMSALILAQVAVDDSDAAPLAYIAPLADPLLTAFLAHLPAAVTLDADRMAEIEADRAGDPNMTARELALLDSAVALVLDRAR